jgi:flagellin
MSNQISTNQLLLNLSSLSDGFDKISSKLSTGKKISAAKDDPVVWTSINKRYAQYSDLSSVKESLDGVATSIHEADSTMGVIGSTIGQMKSTLQQVMISFPPFPPGSEERIKLLKTFAEFRQQIDALTNSPDTGAKKIMSEEAPSDWTIVIGSDNIARTVRKEDVSAGSTGLNIPDLGTDATDPQIKDAIAALDKATATLEEKRQALSVDAAGIARTGTFIGAMAGVNQSTAESANEADMTEAGAELQSINLQQSLSYEALNISSQTDSKILQLLG